MKEMGVTAHMRSKIFGPNANFKERYIPDYNELKRIVEHCKGLGLKIVVTQGTYDMLHIGHARYFEQAKKHGDVLIVAVDSDEKVRKRKGPERPIVPEMERLEMVAHTRAVDIVTLKKSSYAKWKLLSIIKPDVVVISQSTKAHDRKTVADLRKVSGAEVVILKPQATTSTSAKLRLMQISTAKKLQETLPQKMAQLIEELAGGEVSKSRKKK